MGNKDFYSILGVERNSTQDEIKKAFRTLAKEYHPDKNPDNPEAEARFKEVSEAYDILGDPEKRQKHDNPVQRTSGFGFGFDDIIDHFNKFNSRRSQPIPRSGAEVRINDTVSLIDALFGATYHKEFEFESFCVECGAMGGTSWKECSGCQGQGFREFHRSGAGFSTHGREPCNSCRGSGGKFLESCTYCAGTKKKKYSSSVDLEIPSGFSGGTTMVSGKGGPGILGGPAGDVVIFLSVEVPKLSKTEVAEPDYQKLLSLLGLDKK